MKRRIAMLVSAVLAASTLAVLASSRAASANALCAGSGLFNLSQGLVFPLSDITVSPGVPTTVTIHGLRTATFSFVLGLTGACLPGGTVDAFGTLHGWCGHSAGTGITSDGFHFGYISVGFILVITGGVTGVANTIPDTLAAQSCALTGPGASQFIVTGLAAKIHCSLLNTLVTQLAGLPGTHNLVAVLHVTSDPIEVHASLHVCVGVL